MNQHKALIVSQYKQEKLQMANFQKKEAEDLKKLELALQYLKELNHKKKKEMDQMDKDIHKMDGHNDERNNIIIDIYKQHIVKEEEKLATEFAQKTKAIR